MHKTWVRAVKDDDPNTVPLVFEKLKSLTSAAVFPLILLFVIFLFPRQVCRMLKLDIEVEIPNLWGTTRIFAIGI